MALSPISDDDWPEAIRDLNQGFAGALNVYRVMAHHPQLLRAWAPLRQHIVKDTALGPERSEIVILRVGVRLGSSYEWAHHVSRARALGMSDERIAAVVHMPEGEDGLLVQAVDAILDAHRLPQGLEADLAGIIGREAVLDLLATVSFYSLLGSLLMTYNVAVDDKVAEEMAARPLGASASAQA